MRMLKRILSMLFVLTLSGCSLGARIQKMLPVAAAGAAALSQVQAPAELQLARTPLPLPRLLIHRRPASIFEYRYEDFEFENYRHHAPIRAPVAV